MKKVLITGFDPFGGEAVNPALISVMQLPDRIEGVKIIKKEIPTVFDKSIARLEEYLLAEAPDAVICVGQAGGRPNITVERIAINQDDARIPDNEGNQFIDRTIVPDGPAAYFSTLPIKAIARDLNAAGVPGAVSNTAGTFVCNHIMYGALHFAATKSPGLKAGFVHIPYLPQQVTDKPTMPSMSEGDIIKGLTEIIRTVITVSEDVLETGGAVC
ncbi:MAG: pyroglutamyl-peptidase I [Turicibacter sp.]|nr:pyroglutamyl-peptidase I [Turicibacter sp.]